MLTGFDHATLTLLDLDRALASYTKLLGQPPRWRGGHPDIGLRGALFGLENGWLELLAPVPDADESIALRQALAARGDRLTTLSFRCDDAAACTAMLRAQGIRATPPQEGEAHGDDGQTRRYRLVELSPRATRGLAISIVERPQGSMPALGAFAPALPSSIDHLVLRSADLEAALALYGKGLGLRLALDTTFAGVRMLFFRLGGVTIEVVHDPSVGDDDVLLGIAYRVADLPGAHARLAAAGFDLGPLRPGNKPGTEVFTVRGGTNGLPTLFLRDPSRDRS
ncbi:MAG TPA: VOC family protein [Polyangiales bacterium]|nr:VOC family protein [Polyangiales bacterium]